MTSKFVKQWSKKIDQKITNDKRSLLQMAICYFKLVQQPSEEAFLKDSRFQDSLLDLCTEDNFHLFFHFLDQNQELGRKMHRLIHLILATLELKLGYLTDEKVPQGLVFSDQDFARVKNSELGKVILDKLSKVKGKKVRKHLLIIQITLLDNLKLSPGYFVNLEKQRLLMMQADYNEILLQISSLSSKDLKEFINGSDLQIERLIFTMDLLKSSLLGCKLLVL